MSTCWTERQGQGWWQGRWHCEERFHRVTMCSRGEGDVLVRQLEIENFKMTLILILRFNINREAWRSNASTTASAKVASISSLRSNPRFQFPDHLNASHVDRIELRGSGLCKRMSPSSRQRCFIESFAVCKIILWKLIARMNRVDIKDAAAFVEGMRHNTHLQALQYVP